MLSPYVTRRNTSAHFCIDKSTFTYLSNYESISILFYVFKGTCTRLLRRQEDVHILLRGQKRSRRLCAHERIITLFRAGVYAYTHLCTIENMSTDWNMPTLFYIVIRLFLNKRQYARRNHIDMSMSICILLRR